MHFNLMELVIMHEYRGMANHRQMLFQNCQKEAFLFGSGLIKSRLSMVSGLFFTMAGKMHAVFLMLPTKV